MMCLTGKASLFDPGPGRYSASVVLCGGLESSGLALVFVLLPEFQSLYLATYPIWRCEASPL